MDPIGARAHVFVADVERPELAAHDRHHLERALRLRFGDEITVSDGLGAWRRCRFGSALEPLEALGEVVVAPAPAPPIAVAFALTKGDRPEWTVQKLTEVGVDRIIPFVAARSVVRWTSEERAAAHVERLRRVAREAASQSRRAWLPEVEDVAVFADLAARPGAVLSERGGDAPRLPLPTLVLVGPEGGWSGDELEVAAAHGVGRIGLGPHVLRAETASMAVGTILTALRAGVVGPS